jgi:dihydrofolate reductase
MAGLAVFENVSLDGFFADAGGGIDWTKGVPDAEFDAFVAENARGGGHLLFGRATYDMMASWWPTPMAAAAMPEVARRMNALRKTVFSSTLETADWAGTTLVRGDAVPAVRSMKTAEGPDMAVLGSGRLARSLLAAGLVDELQLVVNPVVLGEGRPLLAGLPGRIGLRLTRSRAFPSGRVLLCYAPAG